MKKNQKSFNVADLILVTDVTDFQNDCEPQLRLGDVVRLNSGGPNMLIVDLDGSGQVTAAYHDDEVYEVTLPTVCCCRVSSV